MIKLISFYLLIDIFIRSFSVLSLILITPLVDQIYLEKITYYTVSFTLLTSVFSFSQLALIPKTVTLNNNKLNLDVSVIFLGNFIPFSLVIISLLFKIEWLFYSSFAALCSFIYQAYQSGNNIHNLLNKILQTDLIWFITSCITLLFLFYMGFKNEFLRIYTHLIPLFIVILFIFSSIQFRKNTFSSIFLSKNLKTGIVMTIYSFVQWFLVFGDKMLLGFFNLNTLMTDVFILTNVLQLHLLGSLAILKAFKSKLLSFSLSENYKEIKNILLYYFVLSFLGIFICLFLYYFYTYFFKINILNPNIITGYALLYFFIGLSYVFYQLIVFFDLQLAINKFIVTYVLPLFLVFNLILFSNFNILLLISFFVLISFLVVSFTFIVFRKKYL